jgi:hypothetical protein
VPECACAGCAAVELTTVKSNAARMSVLGVHRPRIRSKVYEYVRTQRADKIKKFYKNLHKRRKHNIQDVHNTHKKNIYKYLQKHSNIYTHI